MDTSNTSLHHTDSLTDLLDAAQSNVGGSPSGVRVVTRTTVTNASYASPGSGGGHSPVGGRLQLNRSPINVGGARNSARAGYGSPGSGYTPRTARSRYTPRRTPRMTPRGTHVKPAYGSFYRGSGGDSPGPGSYDTTSYAYNKRKNAPKFSMGSRFTKGPEFIAIAQRRAEQLPGPGAYSSQSSFKQSHVYTSSHLSSPSMKGQTRTRTTPAYSFGTAKKLTGTRGRSRVSVEKGHERELRGMYSQGPGRYNHKSLFASNSGIGVTNRGVKRAPSFGFGSAPRF